MDQNIYVNFELTKKEITNDERLKCGAILYENYKIIFECFFCGSIIKNNQSDFIQHLIQHLPIDWDDKQDNTDEHVIEKNKNTYVSDPESEFEIDKKSVKEEYINENLNLDEENFFINSLKETSNNKNFEVPMINQNNIFCCPVLECQYSNETIFGILQHMLFNHNMICQNGSKFRCLICQKEYNRSNHVDRHLKSKHGYLTNLTYDLQSNKNLRCCQCDTVYSQYHYLNSHLKKHHLEYFNKTLLQTQEKFYVEHQNYLNDFTWHESIKNNVIHPFLFSKIDEIWSCEYCEVKEKLHKDIFLHFQKHHVNNTVCSVRFEECCTNDDRISHQKNHSDKIELPIADLQKETLSLEYSLDFDCNECLEIDNQSSNKYVDKNLIPNILEVSNLDDKCKIYCQIKNCEYKTTDKMILFTHILEMHNLFNRINTLYQCSICEKEYVKHDIVVRHLKNKHGILSTVELYTVENGLYKCPKCDASYKQKQCMNTHLKNNHKNYFNGILIKQQKEYEIQDKKYSFNENFQITNNRKNIHETNEFSLDLNKKSFNFSEIDELWHCRFCETTKKNKLNLLNHIRGTHVDNTVCDICGKKYSTSGILREHRKSHSESKYKCNICEKIFKTARIYREHVLRVHTGIKKFKCNYCDNMFFDTSSRKSHERIVHLKDKSYQCDICGESFYTSTRLRYHIQRHTGEKPFHCDLCEKTFFSNEMLLRHRPLHFDAKPFECNICLAKFKTKRYLRWHKEHHSNIEKYECSECRKRFNKYTSYYTHKKSMHCLK